MKRPHEQEWSVRKTNHGPMVDAAPGCEDVVCMVYHPAPPHVRSVKESEAAAMERARFIAAAPAMARALEDVASLLADITDGNPAWHAKGRVEAVAAKVAAARREAGVLPAGGCTCGAPGGDPKRLQAAHYADCPSKGGGQ